MLLHQLIHSFDSSIDLQSIANVEIGGICEDSRLAKSGDVFIARTGLKDDGRQYIAEAVVKGAVAVVCAAITDGCAVPQVVIKDTAGATSQLAHLFYRQPSRQVRTLGITGTNGKTTTAYLIRHLLKSAGQRCAAA